MTAPQLLDELHRRGARAWTENGRLELEAPPGVLSERVLQSLRAFKPALLELLQSEAPALIEDTAPLEPSCNAVKPGTLMQCTAPEVGTSWKPLAAGNLLVSSAARETLWSPKSAENPMESAAPEELEKVGDVKKEKNREAPAEPKPAPVWRVPAGVTPEAVLKAAKRIKPELKRQLSLEEHTRLAVSLACLDCGIDPELL